MSEYGKENGGWEYQILLSPGDKQPASPTDLQKWLADSQA